MNEKIKALKVQARDFYLVQEDLDCSNSDFVDLVTEKLVELVVQECVGVADDYVKDCLCKEHIICNHPRSKIGIKIKEHFGVK